MWRIMKYLPTPEYNDSNLVSQDCLVRLKLILTSTLLAIWEHIFYQNLDIERDQKVLIFV